MATKKNAAKRTAAQLAYDKRRAAAKNGKAAPAKKAATKKAPAKKTAAKSSPLKGRKLGPRKPKNVVEQTPVIDGEALEATAQVMSAQADKAVQEDVREEQDQFLNIEIIDLRGLDTVAKFAVVVALNARGYIAGDTSSLTDSENLLAAFYADAMRLQHKNKLVSLVSAEAIRTSAAVSRVDVAVQANVEFSEPTPSAPTTIDMHGVTYLRIG